MKASAITVLIICSLSILSGCAEKRGDVEPVTIAIGSWYGFYALYYAQEHELDLKHGLKLKILEPLNISGFRRTYTSDEVDMAGASMIEFTNARVFTGQDIQPVLISDYSNGGDVIIAKKAIRNASQLRGKVIAVPPNGIGEFLLSLMFNDPEPSKHFAQRHISETQCEQAFINNSIDACVTYPPMSTKFLEIEDLHQIYSSESHPREIFDLIWAKPHLAPGTIQAFQNMWYDSIALIKQDPVAYYAFIARIADVDATAVKASMQSIKMIEKTEMLNMLEDPSQINQSLVSACYIARAQQCERFANTFNASIMTEPSP